MSGSFMNSTSTTKPQLLGAVKPLMNDLMKDATKAYGQGPYFFNKSTVTPFSQSTRDALGGMRDLATANTNGNGMSASLNEILNGGGFTGGQRESLDALRGYTQNAGINEIANGSGLTQAQTRALGATERAGNQIGDYADQITAQGGLSGDQQAAMNRWREKLATPFSTDTPGYSEVRKDALADQSDSLTARSIAMGRYGSGADQSILAREQGRLGAALDNAEFQRQENQDDQAAASLFGGGQTANTNVPMLQGAAQDAQAKTANLSQLGVNNRNQAIGLLNGLQSTLFNAEASGLDRLGQAYDTSMQPFYAQRAVGQEYEDKRNAITADKLRRFDAQNPLSQISQYLSLATGVPSGSSTTTTPSWLQTGLGLGIGGYGLLNAMNRSTYPAAPTAGLY